MRETGGGRGGGRKGKGERVRERMRERKCRRGQGKLGQERFFSGREETWKNVVNSV